MTASSGTSPEIPVVTPLHLLRTKALHAVVVKIVWHCNERVMDELEGEIKAFQGIDMFLKIGKFLLSGNFLSRLESATDLIFERRTTSVAHLMLAFK